MSCEHCEHIRARQRALIDELGVPLEWSERTDELWHLTRRRWTDSPQTLTDSLPTCDCECHDIARFVGKLPKLAVT